MFITARCLTRGDEPLDRQWGAFWRCAELFLAPQGLPPTQKHDHKIPLMPGIGPINIRPYRYPYYRKNEIERLIAWLLNRGVIRPSSSPYSSLVLLVKKHGGSWRLCVDYRALNDITIKDKFLIHVVNELLDELHGAQYFTKLDLRSVYHQICLQETDVEKTAFRTHHCHFEFLVMPFGLTNSPSSFRSLINDIFLKVLCKFVLVFFDDSLIYSTSSKDHLTHVAIVLLEILWANKLFVLPFAAFC